MISLRNFNFIDVLPNELEVINFGSKCNTGSLSFNATSISLNNGIIESNRLCNFRSLLKCVSSGNTTNSVIVNSNNSNNGNSNDANLEIK